MLLFHNCFLVTVFSPKIYIFVLFISIFFGCNWQDKRFNQYVKTVKNPPLEEVFNIETFDLQGHRGCRGLMPENSVEGFQKALELGVRTIEMELAVTKDSILVVSHEPFISADICLGLKGDTLDKKTEKTLNIFQLTLAEVQKFDCGSRGQTWLKNTQQHFKTFKPSLKRAINKTEQYAKGKNLKSPFYSIEIPTQPETDSVFHPKPEVFASLLYEELKSLKILDRIRIQSFDVRALRAFKQLNEEIPLVLLVENTLSLRDNIERLGFTPSIYSPYHEYVTQELVKEVHEFGIKIIPWTVNEPKDIQKMKKMGVDGIVTDYPDRF